MRKSSLGRRSSTHIPVRVPSIGGSATRTCSGKKNTGTLLRPGFSQARRSQSADRESCGSYGGRLMRANTMSAMTPKTPRHTGVHGALPVGSARAPKSQTVSTDSARRMSSFGGAKRKDTRPLGEKPFQQAAQAKVQEYFDMNAIDVVGPGNSIRPMNIKLFVDMMNHLLGNLDSRIVISKSNYLDELPPLLRKLGYRSKVDRSWLMTVNTPLNWQYVIGVLSWLVDLKEIMDQTDAYEMMYPNIVDQTEETEEDDEDAIVINRELVFHLKRSHQVRKYDEDRLACMDEEFLEKQIRDLQCTDEDFETLQRQIDLNREELEGALQRKNMITEELQAMHERHRAVLDECESMKDFIEQSKNFIDAVEMKLETTAKEIEMKRVALAKKKEELQKIQDKVNSQQISLDEIEKLNVEKINLQRMINFYENSIREYQNSAFTVEMKLAEGQKKLEKFVLEYNKLVAEKVVLEPRLKNCEVHLELLTDISSLRAIDSSLRELKEEYKHAMSELESKREECKSIFQMANEDMEITREEIDKETSMLKGLERDIEKHKEVEAKETEKLKDEINRCKEISKKISEEMSQFDPAKLEEKKQMLKRYEHDLELVKKRSKQYLEKVNEIHKEILDEIEPLIKQDMENEKKIRMLLNGS